MINFPNTFKIRMPTGYGKKKKPSQDGNQNCQVFLQVLPVQYT